MNGSSSSPDIELKVLPTPTLGIEEGPRMVRSICTCSCNNWQSLRALIYSHFSFTTEPPPPPTIHLEIPWSVAMWKKYRW